MRRFHIHCRAKMFSPSCFCRSCLGWRSSSVPGSRWPATGRWSAESQADQCSVCTDAVAVSIRRGEGAKPKGEALKFKDKGQILCYCTKVDMYFNGVFIFLYTFYFYSLHGFRNICTFCYLYWKKACYFCVKDTNSLQSNSPFCYIGVSTVLTVFETMLFCG